IGRTGKGYQTRIGFDLDSVMSESGCVQCGECMVSCPTGALSLRRRVQPQSWADSPARIPQNPNTPFPAGSGFLTADEMHDVWLHYLSPTRGPSVVFPFRTVPYSYLKWNEGAVRRWVIPAGESRVLCREGEYGSTAFLLHGTGKFHIHVGGPPAPEEGGGFFAKLFARPRTKADPPPLGRLVATRPGNQLVIGEMACLTHQPRSATVVAEADPAVPALELVVDKYGWPAARVVPSAPATVTVYEVTRNLLDMMQRTPTARANLEEVYTARAVEDCVERGRFGVGLPPARRHEVSEFLLGSGRLEFRRVAAGETVVAEGESAHDVYILRVGTVRLFRTVSGRDHVVDKRGRNDYFGAVALLADDLRWRGLAPPGEASGRIASVAAVDPVEVVRVPGDLFRELCARFPDLKEQLIEDSARRLAEARSASATGILGEYVQQGLFQGQRLLALDLVSCTRCDECTRACADSHDGHSRLLRDGLRFGDFLVATSCRSCHKPYCMDGCPVDAIHRKHGHLQVVIEDHCIGCGLCERNCPCGAIQMVPRDEPRPPNSSGLVAATRRAVNCDLCGGGTPYCVEACPHDAAFRLTGEDLYGRVLDRMKRRGEA
ncbi:MAG: cyclic nucleotide-binding domain-containing protein, partial [Gemmataceae bacterium]